MTRNSPYWFSQKNHAIFIQRYDELMEHKKQLYKHITTVVQMDNQELELQQLMDDFDKVNCLIKQLDYVKKNIVIIGEEHPKSTGTVVIGSLVTVQFNDEETQQYEIIGYGETNIERAQISYTSNLGALLLGKSLYETIPYRRNNIQQKITILAIEEAPNKYAPLYTN